MLAVALSVLAAAAAGTDKPVIGTFFTTDGQSLFELPYNYVANSYERTDDATIVIHNFWQSGRDLTVNLGTPDDDGYYTHLTLDLPGGHDHYGRHYYLCDDYSSLAIGTDERSDSFFTDYCFYYRDANHDELCLTYWSEVLGQWCIYLVDFRCVYSPEWTGDIVFPDADRLSDLLHLQLTFPCAKQLSAGPSDILGLIYDTHGLPYALVFGSGPMALFGNVSFYRDVATVTFTRFADLDADLQASAARIGARIGAFATEEDCATVVFASKSFVADGQLVEDLLVQKYDLNDGILTNLDSVNATSDSGSGASGSGASGSDSANGSSDKSARNAATYTLDGRRATKYDIHAGRFCIDAGRKVIK